MLYVIVCIGHSLAVTVKYKSLNTTNLGMMVFGGPPSRKCYIYHTISPKLCHLYCLSLHKHLEKPEEITNNEH